MTRRWIRALLALVWLGAVAACGSDGGDSSEAQPPVAPLPSGVAARLEISPPGGLFASTTDRRLLTVRAFDASGTEIAPPADVSMVATGTDFALKPSVNGFELAAARIGGSTLVVATSAALSSKPALFYAAEPAAGALLVGDEQVRAAPTPVDTNAVRGVGFRTLATLSGVGLPAPGALMVGTGAQAIAGKVVSSSANLAVPADTDVVLEAVSLPTLFANLSVSAEFTPEQIRQMVVLTPSRKTASSATTHRVVRRSLTGADCKGDAPALGVMTGELEATLDPHLRFEFVATIANHQPQHMRFAAFGSLDVAGKAVLNLGASVTGGVTCKAMLGYVPIPITGPLSPFIAPVVPLDAKFELAAQVSANAFSFVAEFKQSAEMDFGLDYDATRAPDLQLQAIKRLSFSDPELTRHVSFPTQASVRVKATAFLGLSSGLAIGGVLGRMEVVEVYAGPEFEVKFGGSYDVANDPVYTSEYLLKAKAGIGPGEHVQKFIETILLSPKAVDLSAKLERSIARTAAASELLLDKATFRTGEELTFTLQLDPSTVDFPLVGYNVSEVRIYRLNQGPEFSAQQVASVVPTPGQTSFELKWTADFRGGVDDASGEPNFFAFVVDKPLAAISGSFPFELGRVRAKRPPSLFKIAGTGTSLLAIGADGLLMATGVNNGGALGAGLPIGQSTATPVRVGNLTDVRSVTGSAWFGAALLGDGSVWAWGWGSAIGYAAANNPTPRLIFASGAQSISSGYSSTAVVMTDGTVQRFGNGGRVRLDNGLANIVAAAQGGNHTLLLTSGGEVWAVGSNTNGQGGSPVTGQDLSVPTRVPGLADVVAIAAGARHSMALKRDGTVWAWGLNASGQLGINASVGQTHVPTQLQLTGVTHISSGENHGMALAEGVAYGWGLNDECHLGIGSRSNARTPVALRSGVVDIDGGEFQSIFTLADGSVWRSGNMASVRVCEPTSTLMQAVPR